MKNSSLKSRLLEYSLTAGAVLAGTTVINAQHIGVVDNTNLVDDTYDIQFGAAPHPQFTIKHVYSTAYESVYIYPNTAYTYGQTQILGASTATLPPSWARALATSSTISNSATTWSGALMQIAYKSTGTAASGPFAGQGAKFIGVKFVISPDMTVKYGWIKIDVPANVSSVDIINHVYEDSGGALHIDNVLPVELTSFSAIQFENAVKLLWETATEVDNYGFEIERARLRPSEPDYAEASWETLGFVEGAGNSNSPKSYQFIDDEELISGDYYYRLKQIDTDGSFEYSDAVKVNIGTPEKFALHQNYPNPFNPTTLIKFSLPESGMVNLTVYNSLGQQVAVLLNQQMEAGSYEKEFIAENFPSGTYIYRITVDDKFSSEKKMLVLK